MVKKHKILIADDEIELIELLEYNLTKEGYQVYTAINGKEALELAQKVKPDLILLDVMMPEMDGMEACNEIKADDSLKGTLVAFLTARGEDYSQIAGFDSGADDYITKPIKPRVLVSRVNALLRRKIYESKNDNSEEINTLRVDRGKYLVYLNNKEITLPKKEFELLSLLMSKPENVFTRETILTSVWGDDVIIQDRTIDVHIRKLREKIGYDYIKTISGVGYKIML
jgi:two-component system alkaline phosphatase synthesis response regulator PhoP